MKNLLRQLLGRWMAWRLRRASQPCPRPAGPVLVVAPHADDETLGCGGLLAWLADEDAAPQVAFVTDSAGSPEQNPPGELARRRRAEALAALSVLGVPPGQVHFLGAADGRLDRLPSAEQRRVETELAAVLRRAGVTEIFLPFLGGGSTEHDAATRLARTAVAASGLAVRQWEYPVWAWWDPRRLADQLARPAQNFRLELGARRERKRRALACHASQCVAQPPRREPALPPVLAALCTGPVEFFFRRQP